ncbi:MAG: PhnD/SsuA/transferrin family substrate-binding protein [Bdellovibrionales bacterium]
MSRLGDHEYICILPFKRRKKFPVEAILRVVRGKGETEYKSQIITRSDSKIESLKDLNGKKFAFTDPSSTSGFVIPSAYLNKAGVELGDVVLGINTMPLSPVYQGQVDAGATYYFPPADDGKMRDARVRVLTQFPDALEKVKVVTLHGLYPQRALGVEVQSL